MSSKLLMWVPLVVASGISAAYIFVVGVDWGFTLRSGTVPSAIVTGVILSAWFVLHGTGAAHAGG